MRKEKKRNCCICGKRFAGHGNNPDPVRINGVCCDKCNEKVIEARITQFFENLKTGQGRS